ncbi:hypothetical protein D9M72_613110 [compost metagenome]
MSHAQVAAPDAEVRAGLESPVAADAAAPAYNVSSKSPVVVPPFGGVAGSEMGI